MKNHPSPVTVKQGKENHGPLNSWQINEDEEFLAVHGYLASYVASSKNFMIYSNEKKSTKLYFVACTWRFS